MRKLVLLMALFAMTVSVNAQENTNKKAPIGMCFDAHFGYYANVQSGEGDSETQHGYGVGVNVGYQLVKKMPLDVIVGFDMHNTTKSDKADDIKTTHTVAALSVPVGFQYRYSINENLRVIPMAAFNMRFGTSDWLKQEKGSKSIGTFDCYNEKDMSKVGLKPYNHFEPGVKLGVRVAYNGASLGYHCAFDLTGPIDGMKNTVHMLTLCYDVNF